MRHRVGIRLLTWGIVAALALGLGACAVAVHPSGALTPTPKSRVTPHTSATPVFGPTSGPVTLALGKPQYISADTIVVTIHNGLATPIYARNEHSNCTLVSLERWANGFWQLEAPCGNPLPTPHPLTIAPGAVITPQLAPGQSDFAPDLWPMGTYRIAFAYVTSADQPFGQSTVVHSTSFVVG